MLKPLTAVADQKNGAGHKGSLQMSEGRKQLRARQREAIWKWQWLGLRDSTPGFKGSLVIILVAAVLVVLYATGVI